jgi:hypothetical protein
MSAGPGGNRNLIHRRPGQSARAVRSIRAAAIGSAILAASICLVACGGGGSSSADSTTPPPGTKTSTATSPQTPATLAAERMAAGHAASFVRAEFDNSVPTFGSEADATERAAAGASLGRYLRARARQDWAAACRGLAASTREGFEKLARSHATSCAPILAALSRKADLADPLTAGLLSLRVRGRNAFALFYGPGHQQYIVPMLREGDAWKPTQPGPIAYPPGASR